MDDTAGDTAESTLRRPARDVAVPRTGTWMQVARRVSGEGGLDGYGLDIVGRVVETSHLCLRTKREPMQHDLVPAAGAAGL